MQRSRLIHLKGDHQLNGAYELLAGCVRNWLVNTRTIAEVLDMERNVPSCARKSSHPEHEQAVDEYGLSAEDATPLCSPPSFDVLLPKN